MAKMPIEFTVPAIPVPQPRARATAFAGCARMYEAKATHPIHAFKASCRMAAQAAYSGGPLEGPIVLECEFVLPRPTLPKKAGTYRFPHTKRGDVDNLLKAVMDALNGITWRDDAQVYIVRASKIVAAQGEVPHVLIAITEQKSN
jgi:Holliday junction resolvase RusA-like endonuclease